MINYYNKIKKKFGSKEFKIGDLCRLLNIKKTSAYCIIRSLGHKNLIVNPLRGIYRLSSSKLIKPSKDIEKIRKYLLNKITRKFTFTGLSVLESFIHHIPYVIIYHVFVEHGSSEDFKNEIKNISNIMVVIEPTLNDINLLLNNVDINKLIIIRENNYFYSSKESLASKESAFVDLYFEVTRKKIPFIKTDLEEIFKSLVINNLINYSRLMKYSKERGLKKEIKKFLQKMSNFVEVPTNLLK
ncbi:MAG: hypothetical protein ISS82_05105 [Nanoarchaeota archaeon]|nr:hypothetical protein [Nanoarchaeota archaeon]